MAERNDDALSDFRSYQKLIERDWERLDRVEDKLGEQAQKMAVIENELRNKAIVIATLISAASGLITTLLNYFLKQ